MAPDARESEGVSVSEEAFVALLAVAMLILAAGVALALGSDMRAGTVVAVEAAAAAGVACWAILG